MEWEELDTRETQGTRQWVRFTGLLNFNPAVVPILYTPVKSDMYALSDSREAP